MYIFVMIKNNTNSSLFLDRLSFSMKKKIFHRRVTSKMTSKLKNSLAKKQAHKNLSFFLAKSKVLKNLTKQSFGITHIVHFYFSSANTFFYVTDSLGILKFQCSAGLVGFKGKQKKSRLSVLKNFFKELEKLKINVLTNKAVALSLTNVGPYAYYIVKKLKRKFFLRFVKNYQIHAYNGCRKKKQLRKK